jgi:hypothetical protein
MAYEKSAVGAGVSLSRAKFRKKFQQRDEQPGWTVMPRISSSLTFFYKWVFPIGWFGGVLFFMAAVAIGGLRSGQYPPAPLLVLPAGMLALGYGIMRMLVFDLVDEVRDAGDALIVRNRGREGRIALSDIINVNYSVWVNPPRVTLTLRNPRMFGSRVTFCAPVRFVPFATSPVIDDLIQRNDEARRRR